MRVQLTEKGVSKIEKVKEENEFGNNIIGYLNLKIAMIEKLFV